ncbi:zinc finger protein [Nephila pilipes]|uniref:Zinc finger protein n=1 Tax=Nephila pilipes TaxID=299642 RepID=A0A8X6PSF9_NEPPI|nr:zinc finger protein [Nephila pilipes]
MALYIHQAYAPQGVDVTYQDLGNRGLQQHHQIYAEPVIQQHQMYRDPTVQQQIYAEHLIPQHTQIYREEDLQQHAQIYRAEDIQQHTQVYREVPQEPQPPPPPPQPAAPTQHVCDICNKTCKSKSDLQAHYAGHTGEKAHICDVCHKGFAQKSTLRTHYLVHSADREGKRRKGKGKKKNSEQPSEEKIVIAITEPEAILQDAGEPNVDQQTVEMDQTVVQVQTEPDQCDMSFADNSGSHDQALIQTEQHVYLENPQTYATIDQQPLTHMVHQALNIGPQGLHPLMTVDQQGIAHLGHQALGPIGHQTLAQIGHQTFTIIGQQPYTTVEQQPLTHIVHSTMAPIVEDQNIPPEGFDEKARLNRHMLGHTGVKPYVCDICQRGFKDKCNMQRHYLTHTGEKPFACDLCERRFREKAKLLKHKSRRHKNKPKPNYARAPQPIRKFPWKEGMQEKLGNNREVALRRLNDLVERFKRDLVLYKEYREVIDGYLEEGIAEFCMTEGLADESSFYLPHHAVVRDD